MKNLFCLLVIIAGLSQFNRAFAFGAAGAAASPYLKMPMGARGTAMGEAFTGLADDAQAMYYNAAGMTQLDTAHLLLMHDDSWGGVRYENIGFAVPAEKMGLDLWGSIGFSYTLLSVEDIPRTKSVPGNPNVYDQSYADQGFYFTSGASVISLSYAWQATKLYSLGATFKALNEKVDTSDGWGIAGDVGVHSKIDFMPGVAVGMTVQNIGSSPTGEPLPINLRIGVGYHLPHPFSGSETDDDKLTSDVDFIMPVVPVDGVPHLSVGTEYFRWFGHTWGTVRLGYRFPTDLGALAGMSAGASLGFEGGGNDYSLDYTFVPYGDLGYAQRMALSVYLDAKPRVIKPHKGPLVKPTGLKGSSGDASAVLEWDASPVKVDGYVIYMTYDPKGGQWFKVRGFDGTKTTVNKLYNGYMMYFAVSSVRKKPDGSISEESPKSEPVLIKPNGQGNSAPANAEPSKPDDTSKSSKKKG
jgi:hypothetical protein